MVKDLMVFFKNEMSINKIRGIITNSNKQKILPKQDFFVVPM